MDKWRGRTVLITGASSGIGLCTAAELAKLGVNVIGCARNIEKINELNNKLPKGSGSVRAIKCDLTKEEEIQCMFEDIKKHEKFVDILINNAGMNTAKGESVLAGKTKQWRDMINVNILALSICAREALSLMASNHVDDGHIININSVVGHKIPPFPDGHFYSATKHMVTTLTEALYMELRAKNSNIRVTSVSPGMVQTEFFSRWQASSDGTPGPALPSFASQMRVLDAKDIADAIVYVLGAPAHVNVKELTIAPTEQKPY
jgi:NADP-dependent 3-hydroxy acid dehydrogenase YdfG